MAKLLVQPYHRTLGSLRGKVGRAICDDEAVIVVDTIHVSIGDNNGEVPGPQVLPLVWVVSEHPLVLVDRDEFHGLLWEDYDSHWITLIILVKGKLVHQRVVESHGLINWDLLREVWGSVIDF
jgi:hypothetical protein